MPTLDGRRAVAILSVVSYHDRLYSLRPLGTGWIHRFGLYGVDLFFAISGFLICSRLLEEERLFGHFSLRSFYVRRAFRILPPALVFLIVVAALALARVFQLHVRELVVTLLFLRNYSGLAGTLTPDSNFVEHFWSLAVEEHFYLILPGVLALTRNRRRLPVLLGLASLVELHCNLVLRSWCGHMQAIMRMSATSEAEARSADGSHDGGARVLGVAGLRGLFFGRGGKT